ncbi:hypothetical protein [Arthrobacter sp. V1I9]|uniref:hypothetical protein n=1 Tax=Arthrobacter sp. V1I9 TaxID=3042275 RepID=UPI0027D852EC|nr:hypothetical protein [Arthrobacter sp. V1I9]
MSTLHSVERACAELLRNGQAVTFTAAAARTGPGPDHPLPGANIRAFIEENLHRAAASGTLTGLTEEIATLRAALDALATSVRAPRRTTPEANHPKS